MPTYIAGYEIDAVLSEDVNNESEITDNPVESGGDTTDHIRTKPKIVTMDCVVSDTPMPALRERRGADVIPSETARQFMESLWLARTPVVLSKTWVRADGSEGSKVYDNMAIQSLGENVTADTGDSYRFKVTFKQITKVTNTRTTVKVAVPRAKKKVDKGNKATSEGNAGTAGKRGSVLKKGLNSIFGGEEINSTFFDLLK